MVVLLCGKQISLRRLPHLSERISPPAGRASWRSASVILAEHFKRHPDRPSAARINLVRGRTNACSLKAQALIFTGKQRQALKAIDLFPILSQ